MFAGQAKIGAETLVFQDPLVPYHIDQFGDPPPTHLIFLHVVQMDVDTLNLSKGVVSRDANTGMIDEASLQFWRKAAHSSSVLPPRDLRTHR